MSTEKPTATTVRVSKIYIVDDHPIVRKGLCQLIDQEPDLKVTGEAEDAVQAMSLLEKNNPDIVLVDISLKGSSGIELIKNIRSKYQSLPILVVSMHEEALYAERALRAGSRGYIMKQEPPENMLRAIRSILDGGIYVSESMGSRMINTIADGGQSNSPIERLSDRELEVFQMIGEGKSTRAIAEELLLSIKTVESYREKIKNKLQLKNATELVQRAIQWVTGGYEF